MNRLFPAGLRIAIVVCLTAWTSVAWSKPPSEADQELVALVAGKFFELTPKPPVADWAWPPLVGIGDDDEVNAHAAITDVERGQRPTDDFSITWIDVPFRAGDKKAPLNTDEPGESDSKTIRQPYLIFFQGYLDVLVRGREVNLARVFGHELSHVMLRHIGLPNEGDTALLQNAFSRGQESDADVRGMQYALKLNYPYDELIRAIAESRELRYGDNSLRALRSTHPAYADRAASVAERERELWTSISAFETGVEFLQFENYLLAERCFTQVTKQMPGCYEAWANLGYCRLMRYCDALEPEDLKNFDLDQLVVGGFYRRPNSIEPSRGVDVDLWFSAVGALREALRIKPDLALAKANLAVSYLVHPNGKEVGKAAELFEQLIQDAKDGKLDKGVDLFDQVALLVNAGVTESATGNSKGGAELYAQALKMLKADNVEALGQGPIKSAMLYGKARQMAASSDAAERKLAIEALEEYLASTSSLIGWWTLAYDRYVELCKMEGVPARSADALKKPRVVHFRPVLSVPLTDGRAVSLNESVAEVEQSFPNGKKSTIVQRTNIHSLVFAHLGLDLVCTDRVLAIRLKGEAAPPLKIQAAGTGGEFHEVRLGMTFKDLEKLLAGDVRGWKKYLAVEAGVEFRYFPELGFGVRLDKDSRDGKIAEIVVAQLPDAAAINSR